MEPVPAFAKLLQQHLRRTDWQDFTDVVIHAEESAVKKHPLYGQGDTLANLKGFIENAGAQVRGATVLTGKAYLCLAEETLQTLSAKHGNEL